MRSFLTLVPVLLAAGSAATAQPVVTTKPIETDKVTGTRTLTVDGAAGSRRVQLDLTRKADGATASRDITRQRTDTGATVTGTASNFSGQTANWNIARERTADGYTATGSGTGFNGKAYGYSGQGSRTANGYSTSRSVTDANGAVVAGRSVNVSRQNGQVTRQVSTTRPQGLGRRR